MQDHRSYKRFDIHVVGEFNIPGGTAETFLGITRNVSCSGFSFETQNFNLVPGDSLEFRFKHPEHNLTAASMGEIVWKRDATKFECLTGIKFKESDSTFTYEMMNIMSAYGRVAAGSFLDEVDTVHEVKNKLKRQWAPGQIADENGMNALVTTSTNRDAHAPACAETGDKDGEPGDDTARGAGRMGMKRFYLPLIIAASLLLVFALPEYYDNFTHSNKDVEPVNEQSAMIQAPENDVRPLSDEGAGDIVEEAGNEGPVMVHGEEQENIDKKEVNGSISESPSTGIEAGRGEEYYIQVGSWKNPEYALEALDRLKQYYPEAYMTITGEFHKVKIPHISNNTQGSLIMSDIRENLHLNALLVLHTSDSP